MQLTEMRHVLLLGALIEYAVILFKKQKVSKYGAPSQSIYSEKAAAAAAMAAATQNSAVNALSMAAGLANLGGGNR